MTRYERLKFSLKLDHAAYIDHKDAVTKLLKQTINTAEGDDLTVDYMCNVDYIGNVVENFEYLLELLNDPKVIVKATHQELFKGKCLFEELILKFNEIEKRLSC